MGHFLQHFLAMVIAFSIVPPLMRMAARWLGLIRQRNSG
jgi:hypothetical protein